MSGRGLRAPGRFRRPGLGALLGLGGARLGLATGTTGSLERPSQAQSQATLALEVLLEGGDRRRLLFSRLSRRGLRGWLDCLGWLGHRR